MAQTYTLDAQSRSVTGKKVGQLRTQGLVPAVIYGAKIQPIHLQIPHRALEITLGKAGGTNLIDVHVDGTVQTVLARSVQRDVIKGHILHVDFLAIDKASKITTEIPVYLTGESPAVQTRQGIVQHELISIVIEALPADLINQVSADLAALKNFGDAITVADLNVPSSIALLVPAETVIARIVAQKVFEEVLTDTQAPMEVEVISKGKVSEEEID